MVASVEVREIRSCHAKGCNRVWRQGECGHELTAFKDGEVKRTVYACSLYCAHKIVEFALNRQQSREYLEEHRAKIDAQLAELSAD